MFKPQERSCLWGNEHHRTAVWLVKDENFFLILIFLMCDSFQDFGWKYEKMIFGLEYDPSKVVREV